MLLIPFVILLVLVFNAFAQPPAPPGCPQVSDFTPYKTADGYVNLHSHLAAYLSSRVVEGTKIPPLNSSAGIGSVALYPDFFFLSLQEIDEQSNIISLVGTLQIRWSVAPLGYQWMGQPGICSILHHVVPAAYSSTWTPKVIPSNMLNIVDFQEMREVMPLEIDITGTASWRLFGRYVLSCSFSITSYPYDYQKCSLEMRLDTETTYSSLVLPFLTPSCSAFYVANSQWDYLGSRQTVQTIQGQSFFKAELVFKRKELYALLSLVIPIVLLGFSGMAMFIIPADSPEKLTVALSILTSFFFIFSLVVSTLPANCEPSPPVLYIYLLTLFTVAIAGAIFAAMILRYGENIDKWELDQQLDRIVELNGLTINRQTKERAKSRLTTSRKRTALSGVAVMPTVDEACSAPTTSPAEEPNLPSSTGKKEEAQKEHRIEEYLQEERHELKVIKRVRIANNSALLVYTLAVTISTIYYFNFITSERVRLGPIYTNTDTSNGKPVTFTMFNETFIGPITDFAYCNGKCKLELQTGLLVSGSSCSSS